MTPQEKILKEFDEKFPSTEQEIWEGVETEYGGEREKGGCDCTSIGALKDVLKFLQ